MVLGDFTDKVKEWGRNDTLSVIFFYLSYNT